MQALALMMFGEIYETERVPEKKFFKLETVSVELYETNRVLKKLYKPEMVSDVCYFHGPALYYKKCNTLINWSPKLQNFEQQLCSLWLE